ncbi:MAG: class I SAM-dependent methyltransferase [Bacteroidia bacterium]|jgi:ubiquinone/menaquinone biosynthesis C-methylase UbiE
MKDRVNWQKNKYSKFWANQVVKYGFDDYCQGLCTLVESKHPQSVFELAIGTGWPFATRFTEAGIQVAGSDISEYLIEQLKQNHPGIKSYVSSYENLPELTSEKYDIVYCFRSTWYFPDLYKAIDNMIRITRKGGFVMFDIMNSDSEYVKSLIDKHRKSFVKILAKNFVKKIMNMLFARNYLMQDTRNIHELPVSAMDVGNYLRKNGIQFNQYSINQISEGMDKPFVNSGQSNSKIIFECMIP